VRICLEQPYGCTKDERGMEQFDLLVEGLTPKAFSILAILETNDWLGTTTIWPTAIRPTSLGRTRLWCRSSIPTTVSIWSSSREKWNGSEPSKSYGRQRSSISAVNTAPRNRTANSNAFYFKDSKYNRGFTIIEFTHLGLPVQNIFQRLQSKFAEEEAVNHENLSEMLAVL